MSSTRRQLSKPGLSYVDANQGRVVTIEDDVLGIKRQIEQTWPGKLSVVWDRVDLVWCVIEHCDDGVDRLVFDTPALDQRVYDRLVKADGARNDTEDICDRIDAINAQAEKEQEAIFTDKLGDALERLQHALRKDGILTSGPVFVGDQISNRRSRVQRIPDYH